jgi:membrane associated rhomboid family serine protease
VSSKQGGEVSPTIAQETGEIPHPHELYIPLLTFIPTKSPVLLTPWVLVTSSFIEENLFGLCLSLSVIFYLGRYLETMWGTKQFAKFILVMVLSTNSSIYLYYRLKSFITTPDEVPPVVLSAMGINMALLVAIKQRIGNHYMILFKGNLRIKVKYLPFLIVVASFLLQLISEEFKITWLLSVVGVVISWSYLRFFKSVTNESKSYLLPFYGTKSLGKKNELHSLHLDTGIVKGDRAQHFAFYTFFPPPISYVVRFLSSIIFNFFANHGFLNPDDFGSEFDDGADYNQQDINNLQSQFIGLSTLKGAGDVAAIPQAAPTLKKVWHWLSNPNKSLNIKSSMDKRRKLALKELD